MVKLKSMIVGSLALALIAVPVMANSCGCKSSVITLKVLAQAQEVAPKAWENGDVQVAERDLNLLLLDYDVAFLVDYASMTPDQRDKQYALLDDLRQKRIAAVNRVADAYAAAGDNSKAVDLLHRHAATLAVQTQDAVAALKVMPSLLAAADRSGDAYTRSMAALVTEACDTLKQPSVQACIDDAVKNSDRHAPGHLDKFAWVAGPLMDVVQLVRPS